MGSAMPAIQHPSNEPRGRQENSMKIPIRSSATAGAIGRTGRRITGAVLAVGLLSGGLAASAQASDAVHSTTSPATSVRVENRTLIVQGSTASDALALRLRAGHPQTLQVD